MEYLKSNFRTSHAQACRVIHCSRTRSYYQPLMAGKDQPVLQAVRQVVGGSRKGRQKVIRLVRKQQPGWSASRIRRVYEQNGFSLFKRMRKRLQSHPANPITIPFKPLEEWAMDFMSDALDNGRRFRILNVIDHFNRQCMDITVGFSLTSRQVIERLERIIEKEGKPRRIRTDNGPEFKAKRFQDWMHKNGIEWSPIEPGKPQQNAIIERFNRTYREDVLDANVFYVLDHAHKVSQQFKAEYNNERLHQSLGYQTPMSYAA